MWLAHGVIPLSWLDQARAFSIFGRLCVFFIIVSLYLRRDFMGLLLQASWPRRQGNTIVSKTSAANLEPQNPR